MKKYSVGVITLLALTLTSLGTAAGSPSTGGTGRSIASQATSTASGRCSKGDAIEAVRRLGLSDVSADYPVWKVLCGAFTGVGSQAMIALISGPDNVGMLYWAVFRWSGTDWQFVMKQRHAAVLTAAGSDIRERLSIYRDGDPRCCPSGGTKTRIWHWNGARFVSGSWEQITKGEPEGRGFDSPSLNISCGMFDDSRYREVVCQSRMPSQKVTMDGQGRVTICRNSGPTDNHCELGDRGEGPIQRLAYGKQITVGRFRCLSLQTGVRCTLLSSGKGFLINRDGATRVAP